MTVVAESPQPPPGGSRSLPAPEPRRRAPVATRAETAECTCPDACERDHELD